MNERNEAIKTKYLAGTPACALSKEYGISDRQIQRILKELGAIRTQSESYRLAIAQGRMVYHTKPAHLKKHRKSISSALRFMVLAKYNSTCALCGRTPHDNIRIEIDHIDNDATHNVLDNLQVLCQECNHGKAMAAFYVEQQRQAA